MKKCFGNPSVCMCASLASEQLDRFNLYGIEEHILHRLVPSEYEHFSFKNMGPKTQNTSFLENGPNNLIKL
jgi:hypothetical protein